MTPEELNKQNKLILRKAKLETMDPISFEQLEAVFDKWMIMPDRGILRLLIGFYLSNKLPGKALWMIIIGPSGGGKTEFLNSLLVLPDIVPVSILTPNTFLSGMPGQNDASLLPKLTGKIMLMKDLTTILSMQKDARAELFAQFREIWDGSMKKIFGNGRIASWTGKVSFLAASTQAVDLNQQQFTHLGERFLNYRLIMPDRKEVGMRSLANESNQDQMEEELQDAMLLFFKGINFDEKNIPQIPDEYKQELVNLANFATLARSGIIRDMGMKKEVIFVPAAEMPTRITGQLAKLGVGIMMAFKGVLSPENLKVIYKTALDSIPQTNKMVIIEMARADGQSTAEIATALGYPTEPIKMYLENLAMLKVCRRVKDGTTYHWTMNEEFSGIVRKYENIQALTKEEIALRASEALHETDDRDEGMIALDEAFPDEPPAPTQQKF